MRTLRITWPGFVIRSVPVRVNGRIGELIASKAVMTAIARRFMWRVGANPPFVGVIASLRPALSCLGRFLCGLSGHDMLRHFEPDRLSLLCARCGAQTPGWTIDVNPAFRRSAEHVATRRDLKLVVPSTREETESRSPQARAA